MNIALLANSMRSVDETVTAPHMYIIREIFHQLNALGHSVQLYGFTKGATPAQSVMKTDWREFCEEMTQAAAASSSVAAREMPTILERVGFVREATHTFKAFQAAHKHADLMHIHWFGHLLGAAVSEIPIVYSVRHGYNDPECWQQIKENAFSQLTDLDKVTWVVLTSPQKKFLSATIPQNKIHVVPHGLNFKQFPKQPGEKKGYAVFLGRIMRLKAPHLAIDAAKLANIPIKIAGGIDPVREGEPDYFQEEIEPRLGPGVEYVGEVGFEEKIELLQGASVVVNPFQLEEPFGLVNTESLACGTPLVVPKKGSALDIVREGVNGFYADYSIEEMAAAIDRCMALDPQTIFDDVRERFSMEKMVDGYLKVYQAALA